MRDRFCKAVSIGWASAKANWLPSLVLWLFAVVVVLAYCHVPHCTAAFESVRLWQERCGWRAVAVSRVFFNGFLPGIFLLSVKAIRPPSPWRTIFAQTVFGCAFGLVGDGFFRLQDAVFGAGTAIQTLLLKTLVDQFVFTVLVIAPVESMFFFWLGRDFSRARVRHDWPGKAWPFEILMPNLIADWFVSIPAALATYAFPLDLQIHVNGLISAFWMLLCLQIGKRSARRCTCARK